MKKFFAEGGFIRSVALILSGVLLALVILQGSIEAMSKGDRLVGRCQGACYARGFIFSSVLSNGQCRCASPGKPDWLPIDSTKPVR